MDIATSTNNNLYQLIYISSSRALLSNDELLALLNQSRIANTTHNITGLLLYKEGTFIQVLEGRLGDIDQLFQNICKDILHSNVILLIKEPINVRSFSSWSMGFKDITHIETEGFSDFMLDESNHAILSEKAKILLSNFTKI